MRCTTWQTLRVPKRPCPPVACPGSPLTRSHHDGDAGDRLVFARRSPTTDPACPAKEGRRFSPPTSLQRCSARRGMPEGLLGVQRRASCGGRSPFAFSTRSTCSSTILMSTSYARIISSISDRLHVADWSDKCSEIRRGCVLLRRAGITPSTNRAGQQCSHAQGICTSERQGMPQPGLDPLSAVGPQPQMFARLRSCTAALVAIARASTALIIPAKERSEPCVLCLCAAADGCVSARLIITNFKPGWLCFPARLVESSQENHCSLDGGIFEYWRSCLVLHCPEFIDQSSGILVRLSGPLGFESDQAIAPGFPKIQL